VAARLQRVGHPGAPGDGRLEGSWILLKAPIYWPVLHGTGLCYTPCGLYYTLPGAAKSASERPSGRPTASRWRRTRVDPDGHGLGAEHARLRS